MRPSHHSSGAPTVGHQARADDTPYIFAGPGWRSAVGARLARTLLDRFLDGPMAALGRDRVSPRWSQADAGVPDHYAEGQLEGVRHELTLPARSGPRGQNGKLSLIDRIFD